MRSPAVRLAAALVCSCSVWAAPRAGFAASVPSGFIDAVVVSGLTAPTAMALAPDGRVFIAEQGGAIRVVKAGVLLPTPFVRLTVDSAGERGAIGVAIDPQFETNGFIYIHYTVPGTGGGASHNRVSRFTASGDIAVPGSQFIVVDLDALSSATNHNGGAIHFGPDGKLYIGVGENANGANAQTLTNRKGKVLRLNKDGSIPTDNPFVGTATGANRAIWALGLRNPFTFAFEAGTTRLYINDVGQSTWEEVDLGIAGSNYGWPTTEGVTSNPSFRSPLYVYGHGSGAMLGCAIAGGAFGRAGASFPASFVGDYFFADLCGGWINRRTSAGVVSTFASGIPAPVDLFTAPDGALFYLARGSGGATGFLGRITGPTGALIGIDPTTAAITQPVTVTGFAIDPSSATGTGIDAIQVWAYPNPGSGQPAVFVAAAALWADASGNWRAVRRALRAERLLLPAQRIEARPVPPGGVCAEHDVGYLHVAVADDHRASRSPHGSGRPVSRRECATTFPPRRLGHRSRGHWYRRGWRERPGDADRRWHAGRARPRHLRRPAQRRRRGVRGRVSQERLPDGRARPHTGVSGASSCRHTAPSRALSSRRASPCTCCRALPCSSTRRGLERRSRRDLR